jgi:hypothetical protein
MPDLPPGVSRAEPQTTFPKKVMGQHRWMAMATYVLSEDEARKAQLGEYVLLDPPHLASVMVGCLDCEEQMGSAAPMCPAPGFDWDRGG